MPPAILVADPNRQTRDMTTSLFHALGFRFVWAADDTRRTQHFLDAVIFDYVVFDGQLASTDINQLIASVRLFSNHTRVVVLSHLPNAAARFPAADVVLGKPLSFEIVRQLMSNQTANYLS